MFLIQHRFQSIIKIFREQGIIPQELINRVLRRAKTASKMYPNLLFKHHQIPIVALNIKYLQI